MNSSDAEISAEAIIKAELAGAQSHGLTRLKMYCERIKKNLINPKPKIKIKKISNSIAHIDGNNGIGFVVANVGIHQAIKFAQKTGIGLVGIRNSGHYGLSSFYAEQAVKKKLIALCFTNAPPAIAPYGSRKALFGTILFVLPLQRERKFLLFWTCLLQ